MRQTKDCIALLVEQGYPGRWVRAGKHRNENGGWQRTFRNVDGSGMIAELTELESGSLSLKRVFNESLSSSIVDSYKGQNARNKILLELLKLFALKVSEDEWDDLDDMGITEQALRLWKEKKNEDKLLSEVKSANYDPKEDLFFIHNLVSTLAYHNDDYSFVDDISVATVGVQYDKENISGTFHDAGGVMTLKLEMGGDWECPVLSFVWWSEHQKRLVGYFPKGRANVYNEQTSTAYGSEHDWNGFRNAPVFQQEMLERKFEKLRERIEEDMDKTYENAERMAESEILEKISNECKLAASYLNINKGNNDSFTMPRAKVGVEKIDIIDITSNCMKYEESWVDVGGAPVLKLGAKSKEEALKIAELCETALVEACLSDQLEISVDIDEAELASNGEFEITLLPKEEYECPRPMSLGEIEILDFACQCLGLRAVLSGLGYSNKDRIKWIDSFISSIEDFYPAGTDDDPDWSDAPSLDELFKENPSKKLIKWLPIPIMVWAQREDLDKTTRAGKIGSRRMI